MNRKLDIKLNWLKAQYHMHTFAYRDPRSAFSSAPGLPVVSPTTVLLGVASTLFSTGKVKEAIDFLKVIGMCKVMVDAPDGVIFFRAFHQLRRYTTDKHDKNNPRLGLTQINQGNREYGLVEGNITIYVGVPENLTNAVIFALENRNHLGTRDSLCSLVGFVETCSEPDNVIFFQPEEWKTKIPNFADVTIVTLSRFKNPSLNPVVGSYWWMSGGEDTELVPYMIPGEFRGTSRGKIFRKRGKKKPYKA